MKRFHLSFDLKLPKLLFLFFFFQIFKYYSHEIVQISSEDPFTWVGVFWTLLHLKVTKMKTVVQKKNKNNENSSSWYFRIKQEMHFHSFFFSFFYPPPHFGNSTDSSLNIRSINKEIQMLLVIKWQQVSTNLKHWTRRS